MTPRPYWHSVAVAVFVLTLIGLFGCTKTEPPAPPKIAGQSTPANLVRLDFAKRYDILLNDDFPDRHRYKACRVVGFTSEEETSGLGSYPKHYFDKWLVLELPDGRRAYLPSSSVLALEEAAPRSP